MSKVNDDEAGNIHLHVYFPTEKEENEPHIGGGVLSKEKQDYPEVSGHPHELLVQDSSNKWWLVVTSGNQDQVGNPCQ